MKADLHVHSRFSTRPSQWILQKIGCPESFTDPKDVYRIAKAKGMDIITITDHNTINGALEIAHLPGVFVSEEITTYFPEDGCKIHVLAYDISEDQHRDIQKVRENIYDLVSYLREQNIIHAVAHPFYCVNGKLTLEHFEKLLLLFEIFEINGARNVEQNNMLQNLLHKLNEGILKSLADRHSILNSLAHIGPKKIISGSDDHSSLNIARFWTQVPKAKDIKSFLEGVVKGEAQIGGVASTPLTMAHNLYGIAYQYYRDRFGLGRYLQKDLLLQFLERILDIHHESSTRSWSSRVYELARSTNLWRWRSNSEKELPPVKALWKISQELVEKDTSFLAIVRGRKTVSAVDAEKLWHRFVEQVCNMLLMDLSQRIGQQLRSANVFDIFGSLGSAGALYSLMAPFFVAFSYFAKEKTIAENICLRFYFMNKVLPISQEFSVAHFSDTVLEINGVARTLLQNVHLARQMGHRLTLLTCGYTDKEPPPGVVNFQPVGRYTLPEYPELHINIPPFLRILSMCYEGKFTQIHAATPGPMGLAALAVARILSVPIVATYHTALPQYVRKLTNDEALESLTWRYLIWYYNQMDKVYVPSNATRRELIEHGLSENKVCTYPRGVDIAKFSPLKYSLRFRAQHKIVDKIAVLYVGRLSKEKDLDILCSAFKKLHSKNPHTVLVVVGDGPYREEMEKHLAGTAVVFTGYLTGEDLSEAFASCDFLVFPSTTDTFGNVVLEAQASGLPVIVSNQGGPQENIIPGLTGLIFEGGNERSLLKCMEWMCNHPEKRKTMGKEARATMEKRPFQSAFQNMWELFERASEMEKVCQSHAVASQR